MTEQNNSPKWVHCNICVRMYTKQFKFLLLSCQHILCLPCLKKGGPVPTCLICNRKVSMMELTNTMDPKYLKLFNPGDTSLESRKFRLQHVNRLFESVMKSTRKTEQYLKEQEAYKKKVQEIQEYQTKLRTYRQDLQNQVRKMMSTEQIRKVSGEVISPATFMQQQMKKRVEESKPANSFF